MNYEPQRLRLSEKTARQRIILRWTLVTIGILGWFGFWIKPTLMPVVFKSEGYYTYLLVGVIFAAMALYWLFLKPNYSEVHLATLTCDQTDELMNQLNHDASRDTLRVWLEEDCPIRGWEKCELMKMEQSLRRVEGLTNSDVVE